MQGTEFVMVPVSWLEEMSEKIDQLIEREVRPVVPELMTADEAEKYTGIPKQTIYKLGREGLLARRKIGSTVRFAREDLDKIGIEDRAG